MPERWLDYRELAAHWGIGPDAARARVRRGNFTRRTNNFGEVEVLVDTDAPIQRPRKRGQDEQTGTSTPDTETASQVTAAALSALQSHITDLKAQIAKADAQTDTLRLELVAERDRVATLTAELLRRTGEMLDAKVKAEAEAARPRGWWARLVG